MPDYFDSLDQFETILRSIEDTYTDFWNSDDDNPFAWNVGLSKQGIKEIIDHRNYIIQNKEKFLMDKIIVFYNKYKVYIDECLKNQETLIKKPFFYYFELSKTSTFLEKATTDEQEICEFLMTNPYIFLRTIQFYKTLKLYDSTKTKRFEQDNRDGYAEELDRYLDGLYTIPSLSPSGGRRLRKTHRRKKTHRRQTKRRA